MTRRRVVMPLLLVICNCLTVVISISVFMAASNGQAAGLAFVSSDISLARAAWEFFLRIVDEFPIRGLVGIVSCLCACKIMIHTAGVFCQSESVMIERMLRPRQKATWLLAGQVALAIIALASITHLVFAVWA